MFSTTFKRPLVTLAVVLGPLAAAGPAGAARIDVPATPRGAVTMLDYELTPVVTYQHNQPDLEFLALAPHRPGSEGFWLGSNDALGAGVTDGTSNTIAFGLMADNGGQF